MPCLCLKRDVAIILGMLECLIYSGFLFGWSSFTHILKDEGYFAKLCDLSHVHSHHNTSSRVNKTFVFQQFDTTGVLPFVPPASGNETGEFPILHRRHGAYRTDLRPRKKEFFAQKLRQIKNQKEALTPDSEAVNFAGDQAKLRRVLDIYPTGNGSEINKVLCDKQEKSFSLVYFVAKVFTGILATPAGIIYDRFGTLYTRIPTITLWTAGILMLVFVSPGSPWLLFPSTALLNLTGYCLLLTNIQLGNYGNRSRYTIVVIFCALADFSMSNLLVKVLYQNGTALQMFFMFMAVGVLPLLIHTIATLPKDRLPWPVPKNTRNVGQRPSRPSTNGNVSGNVLSSPPFQHYALSKLFLGQMAWLFLLYIPLELFIAFWNEWISDLIQHHGKDKVSQLQFAHVILQYCGVLVAPLLGLILDWNGYKKQTQSNESSFMSPVRQRVRSMRNSIVLYLLMLTFATVFAAINLMTSFFGVLAGSYFTLVPLSFLPICLMASNAAFLLIMFPMSHFGKLFGISQSVRVCVTVIVSTQSASTIRLLFQHRLIVHAVTIIISLLPILHIISMYYHYRQERLKINNRSVGGLVPTSEELEQRLSSTANSQNAS